MYLQVVVKLGNRRKGCTEFGRLDCDNVVSNIKQKKSKTYLLLVKIVVSESECLHAHIFILVLIDNHYILLWFNKRS